jgi:hypothetical protein
MFSALISVIIIILIVFTIADIKNKNKKTISFKESMDLTELPIITFSNNNIKLNFLLDTGSNISHINSSVLNKLQYSILNKEISTVGFTGEVVDSAFCKMELEYKGKTYKDEFSITNLDEAFGVIKQESGVQIHGILGSKFFERYKYILDFSKLEAYTK